MSTESLDPGHGHSLAAWTGVIIALIGIAAGTVFFYLDMPWFVVGSAVLALIGFLVGWIMKMLGYGADGEKSRSKVH